MHWVNRSTIVAFGKLAHRAACSHGSRPRRARTERTVSTEPFVSVPTSAKRNVLRPDFSSAKTSDVLMVGLLHPSAEGSAGYKPWHGNATTASTGIPLNQSFKGRRLL